MTDKRIQIMLKLAVLLGGCLLVMIFLIGVSLYQVRSSMMQERKDMLRKMVETTIGIARYQDAQAKSGAITQEEAKSQMKNAVRAMRFGEGGYFFVTDMNGFMLAHPAYPELENQNQIELHDQRDVSIIREVIAKAVQGGGFAEYSYKKPGSGNEMLPKVTYGQAFEPWGWVFATGAYLDDIQTDFNKKILTWVKIVVGPFGLLIIIAYYLGALIAKPFFDLELAKQNAETATRAKSDFLANMSHEIRTPLNGSMGMLTLLLGTKVNAQQREWAQIAYQSSEELLNLINDILDISKVESGCMNFENVPFDLQYNVKAVTDLLYSRAHRKGVEIVVSFQPAVPRTVVGDPVRLRQILINLVGNAIKFTSEGYIMISVDVEEGETDHLLKFEVNDTGTGIPEDKLDYIFEKFSQAEESTTRNFGGTGLGLAICRKLTALMGGDVGVRSKLGKGSTFWFNVRMNKACEKDKGLNPSCLVRPISCLVYCTNEVMGQMRCANISYLGATCTVADLKKGFQASVQDGDENGKPYHFVFVDMESLGNNPTEMTSAIDAFFALSPDSKLIVVASPDKPFTSDDVQLKHSVGVLTKPIFPQELHTVMTRLSGEDAHTAEPCFIMARKDQLGWSSGKDDPENPIVSSPSSGKWILVAEDQQVNQMMMKALISQMGYQVDLAGNGLEAVRMAAEKKYDMVLMDGHMPEMDGLEATKQIREFEVRLGRHTPIVALTADAMKGDRDKCIAAGMDDYMYKPVKAAQIKEMIEKYIG